MTHPTPTHKLATALLGQPLEQWVRARRAEGMSWRLLSCELWAATGKEVLITYESLRSWFPDEGEAA